MAGFWDQLGQGLQGAGAVLSPQVYQEQAQERQNSIKNLALSLQVNQTIKKLTADQQFSDIAKGLNLSGLRSSSEQFDAFQKAVPLDVLSQSESAQQVLGMITQRQKQEEAQQAKMIQLQNQANAIEERADWHQQMAQNQESSAVERARHNLESERLREILTKMGLDVKRQSVEEKNKAKAEKEVAPVQNIIDQTDAAIRMLDQNPQSAGGVGMFTRGKEFVQSTIDPTTPTPGSDFQQQILGIQSQWRKLPSVAANRFKADAGKIDSQIKGLGTFTSYAQARNSLVQFRNTLAKQIGQDQADEGSPQGLPESPPKSSGQWKVEKIN
jgi:hypothetical protein